MFPDVVQCLLPLRRTRWRSRRPYEHSRDAHFSDRFQARDISAGFDAESGGTLQCAARRACAQSIKSGETLSSAIGGFCLRHLAGTASRYLPTQGLTTSNVSEGMTATARKGFSLD
jgi:hypothetical protein